LKKVEVRTGRRDRLKGRGRGSRKVELSLPSPGLTARAGEREEQDCPEKRYASPFIV